MHLVILPLILESSLLDTDTAKYCQGLMYYTQSHQKVMVVFLQTLTKQLSDIFNHEISHIGR